MRAWHKLRRLIQEEQADREVYELSASILGTLGNWSNGLRVLKSGLGRLIDGDDKRRLCFLVGDIYQRVESDCCNAAGWFVQAARHGHVDAELMRCFHDAARMVEVTDTTKAQRLLDGTPFLRIASMGCSVRLVIRNRSTFWRSKF